MQPMPATDSRSAVEATDQSFISRGYVLGFALVTLLFFLWAIANNLNDILIRQFQKALSLNRTQAGLIQFAFYLGYFTMALPAGLLMRRWGYRAGIISGLLLYATGAALFYPAAELRLFSAFLGALFVIASGAAFLETAANPYVVHFGDPARAAQRLNLAQAFNGLGASIAPIVGGMFIFSGVEYSQSQLQALSPAQLNAYHASEAHMVQTPYLILSVVVLCMALAIAIVKLPPVTARRASGSSPIALRSMLRTNSFVGSVIAQFFYVGAQVGIWSFFIDFVKQMSPQIPERVAAYMLSGSLVLFMLGRFSGAAAMARVRPEKLLFAYSVINIVLCAIAAVCSGLPAIGALMLSSFFMSIMFPTIFSLGLRDLDKESMIASSAIIMAIIGGAIVPPVMGWISQNLGTVQTSIFLPLICFVVVAAFAKITIGTKREAAR